MKSRAALLLIVFSLAAMSCTRKAPSGKKKIEGVGSAVSLSDHTKIFTRRVEQVAGNVHVAIGFGLANSIMVEGTNGLIIIDTMATREEAKDVLAAFRKISDKPVKAIIYTHNHVDHTLGAEVFAAEGRPEVYAHESTAYYVNRLVSEMRPCITMRSMRMFGSLLDDDGLVNAGIGPRLGIGRDSTVGFVPPTRTFADKIEDEVAGIKFQLIHAPGETDDQLFVWLPEEKVLMPGDNFYWSFPNLYTIRGTPFRSLKRWYQSLDEIRDRKPDYLVPSHTGPLRGAGRIDEILTDYRDAIQFVRDQAIRGMNMGMTADELAETIKLPAHLSGAPYLQPFYGKVSWSVRAMFAGHLGWFDGDSATLEPLTRRQRAKLMARIAGGEGRLLQQAKEALDRSEYQAAVELTGHLVRLNPSDREARRIRVKALIALGEKEENPNARHYYLTEALEIRDGFIARRELSPTPSFVNGVPMQAYFDSLAVNLDPVSSAEVDQQVGMVFPDIREAYTIHVRRGVAEIRRRSEAELDHLDLDIELRASSTLWKEMLAKLRAPVITLPRFDYEKGNALTFARFLKMFRPPKPKLPFEPLAD